jgi:histidinol-phosphate aminotransferase
MKINRRNLLKTGLLSLSGMALAPHLRAGACGSSPITLDASGRIFYSPMMREHFLDNLPAFQPLIRISANENPYGPPPLAREAIKTAMLEGAGSRYSWQELGGLVAQIATKEGVSVSNIMMGAGSSDLLERTAYVLCAGGGNVVSADPTYMSLVRVAEAVGADWKAIPCKADWSHDLERMESAIDKNTRLVYVCNPNNPVGSVSDAAHLMEFCRRVSERVPVFVDEAYMDFANGATRSMVSLLSENKNVIISRTFSKVMGMAGLRVGYLVGLKPTLDTLQRTSRGGAGITYTSIVAARAALDDVDFQKMTITKNEEAKQYLYGRLKKLNIAYLPSYTNFALFPIATNGKDFLAQMAEKGIGIRAFDIQNRPWCRVSIGTMDEIKQFVRALEEVV